MLDLSPASEVRVVKSKAEIKGMEYALKLESAALIAFYADLEKRVLEGKDNIYEHQVPQILDQFRVKIAGDDYLGINSFDMILGSGKNGAIIHYRADES